MKLKKLVKILNKHLEDHPEHADLKVTVSRMGRWSFKHRSLFLMPQVVRRNKDNTSYDEEVDDYSDTEQVLSIGEI